MSDDSKVAELALEVVQIKNESTIQSMVDKYKNLIAEREKGYYTINVTDVMRSLAHCGPLVQLSYASSDGYHCQAEIFEVLSTYATLVKDSYIACAKFLIASFDALKYHKIALKLVEKNKPIKAVQFVSKCSVVAGTMATEAGKLSVQAQDLSNMAAKALKSAINDKTVSKQQRAEIEKRMSEANTKKAELNKLMRQLNSDLNEAKVAESEAVKQAQTERGRQFALNLIKTTVAPLTELYTATKNTAVSVMNMVTKSVDKGLGNDEFDDEKCESKAQSQSLDDRALLLTKNRIEIKNRMIEQNEDLANTLAELSSLQTSGDSLAKSLKALELAIKTLGKIVVIYANTKKFWEGVEANCLQIVKNGDTVNDFAEDGFEEELKEAIECSALNWFVLCKVNFYAKKAISSVDKGIDAILCDLPNESEALKLVPVLSSEMKQILNDESKAIEASK